MTHGEHDHSARPVIRRRRAVVRPPPRRRVRKEGAEKGPSGAGELAVEADGEQHRVVAQPLDAEHAEKLVAELLDR
ncbi:hypothetical protein C8D89_11817 [Actinomycetospora cinnamomea]|uniref:Uncharacterized protein n=1 Tax=Actinomycetospora cinnamomea TaxID=663609 RepID=A0A2U1EWX1_9PSEU|nr:hypothetical protein C8D89_11817 [Actinomycetospora cinnamomea]